MKLLNILEANNYHIPLDQWSFVDFRGKPITQNTHDMFVQGVKTIVGENDFVRSKNIVKVNIQTNFIIVIDEENRHYRLDYNKIAENYRKRLTELRAILIKLLGKG